MNITAADKYSFQFLSGNALKILALISMTVDHIGMILFPRVYVLRIIGRLAFPIFAYMVAEGCYYTRNKKKYIGLIFAVGVLCQIIAYVSQQTLYMCIMITFTLSLLIIFSLQKAIPDRNRHDGDTSRSVSPVWCVITAVLIGVSFFLTEILENLIPSTDFHIDYGFFGVMLPVLVYVPNLFLKEKNAFCRLIQTAILAIWILLLWRTCNRYEWFAVFSAVLLLFYNGERGRLSLKYLFYIYYPAHLGVLYLIGMLTQK